MQSYQHQQLLTCQVYCQQTQQRNCIGRQDHGHLVISDMWDLPCMCSDLQATLPVPDTSVVQIEHIKASARIVILRSRSTANQVRRSGPWQVRTPNKLTMITLHTKHGFLYMHCRSVAWLPEVIKIWHSSFLAFPEPVIQPRQPSLSEKQTCTLLEHWRGHWRG